MEVVEGKCSVLKKMEETGLGDFMVPQAFKTAAAAHLPLGFLEEHLHR